MVGNSEAHHDTSVIHALRLNQSTPVRALCIRLSGLSAAGEDDLILGGQLFPDVHHCVSEGDLSIVYYLSI